MNRLLRETAKAVLPTRVLVTVVSKRWWDYNARFIEERGILDISRRFVARYGTTVLHGQFQGLKYPELCALTR